MTPLNQLRRWALLAVAYTALGSACPREPEVYRGPGLQAERLPVNEMVGVYRAALGASFTLGDPALSLLVDPLLLPRGAGLAGGDSMPPDVRSALQRNRLVRGTCEVPVKEARLVCRTDRPGYAVRLSAPLALGPRHDSVQVHLVAQQYGIPNGRVAERIRFERAYHLVRRGQTWRAVSEARLPRP